MKYFNKDFVKKLFPQHQTNINSFLTLVENFVDPTFPEIYHLDNGDIYHLEDIFDLLNEWNDNQLETPITDNPALSKLFMNISNLSGTNSLNNKNDYCYTFPFFKYEKVQYRRGGKTGTRLILQARFTIVSYSDSKGTIKTVTSDDLKHEDLKSLKIAKDVIYHNSKIERERWKNFMLEQLDEFNKELAKLT